MAEEASNPFGVARSFLGSLDHHVLGETTVERIQPLHIVIKACGCRINPLTGEEWAYRPNVGRSSSFRPSALAGHLISLKNSAIEWIGPLAHVLNGGHHSHSLRRKCADKYVELILKSFDATRRIREQHELTCQ